MRDKKYTYPLEKENKELKQQEQDILQHAKIEARNILIQAKEDANDMIKEMSSSTNRKNLENARNTLEEAWIIDHCRFEFNRKKDEEIHFINTHQRTQYKADKYEKGNRNLTALYF